MEAQPGRRFRRLGITANLDKEPALDILTDLLSSLAEHEFDVFVDDPLHAVTDTTFAFGIPDDIDLIIAIGGDGTILANARRFADFDAPILGLKGGHLGFLAESRLENVAQRIAQGRFAVQRRTRIDGTVMTGDASGERLTALNEFVVHGAGFSRMVNVEVRVDGQLTQEFFSDGVIVATPTGSTAYSLSAGGPVVAPTVQVSIITPLNPHTMSVRPVVVDATQTIDVNVLSGNTDIVITADGQLGRQLQDGESLRITESETPTYLAVPDDYNFFTLLREKL